MQCDFCLKVNIISRDKQTEVIKNENCVYQTESLTVAQTGSIFDKSGRLLGFSEIVGLYKIHGLNITEIFDGLYNLVVIDRKIEKAFIFHDHLCGQSHVFYHFDGENIFISSSIRNIVNSAKKTEWFLDEDSIGEFINKGYVCENRTLIFDIYKASYMKYTEFNLKSGYVAERNSQSIEYEKKDNITEPRYDRIFDDEVIKCAKGKYAVDFRGDYDSTYIIHHARLNEPERKHIKAYCCTSNAEKKRDALAKICGSFNNTDLTLAEIGKDVLNYLPLLVYITEGTAFDPNAFRDIEVAKALKKDGVTSIISGDGTGGLFSKYFFLGSGKSSDRLQQKVLSAADALKHSGAEKERAERLVNLSVDQSGMIMNYFDISYYNPYLMKKFVQTVYKKSKNGQPRQFHCKAIEENLPQQAAKIATRQSPKVDVLSLFGGSIDAKTISTIASRSYYRTKFACSSDDNRARAIYCLRIIYVELFQTVFLGRNKEKFLTADKFNYSLKAFFPNYFKKGDMK
ncbi:MAG: hypothetical protein IJS17_01375 [Clostridia bacterium]|nr:hypothetical protein [Clostridia bacterium]